MGMDDGCVHDLNEDFVYLSVQVADLLVPTTIYVYYFSYLFCGMALLTTCTLKGVVLHSLVAPENKLDVRLVVLEHIPGTSPYVYGSNKMGLL